MIGTLNMLTSFSLGGALYVCVEILWRGYSHISMFFVGGLCFLLIGNIGRILPWELGLLRLSLIGACIITAAEFASGMLLNVWLRLDVWDYSTMPLNLCGQICLLYSLLWIPLSAAAVILNELLQHFVFGKALPAARWF